MKITLPAVSDRQSDIRISFRMTYRTQVIHATTGEVSFEYASGINNDAHLIQLVDELESDAKKLGQRMDAMQLKMMNFNSNSIANSLDLQGRKLRRR